MFDSTPDPIAFTLGPLSIGWYGLGYAVGLAAAYLLLTWLARRAGEDPELVGNGIIIVAIVALIGGRLYHVIDQWALYANDPVKIFLPPYSGLGVYGGLLTGIGAVVLITRAKGVSFWRWADIIVPSLFVMQAIARWGNYFNQELYGPPTTLPWGIPIDCEYRVGAYLCGAFPFETTRFHPLFLYESLSGVIGAAVLIWIGFRFRDRLRPGDIAGVFFIWYALVRLVLESLREDNWTAFGIPVAQLVSVLFIVVTAVILIRRHRSGAADADLPPSIPGVATWGAIGPNDWKHRPISEPWANVDPFADDDDPFDDDEVDDEAEQVDDERSREVIGPSGVGPGAEPARDPFDDEDDLDVAEGAPTPEPR